MGLHRLNGAPDLSRELFGRSPGQPMARTGIDSASAGAAAAAEAAAIAASLGGLPDTGLPTMGSYQVAAGQTTISVGIPTMGGQLGGVQVEDKLLLREPDAANAPPPLPRLSGRGDHVVDEMRVQRPTEATVAAAEVALAAATAMAAAERGNSASTGSSWVAPAPLERGDLSGRAMPASQMPSLRTAAQEYAYEAGLPQASLPPTNIAGASAPWAVRTGLTSSAATVGPTSETMTKLWPPSSWEASRQVAAERSPVGSWVNGDHLSYPEAELAQPPCQIINREAYRVLPQPWTAEDWNRAVVTEPQTRQPMERPFTPRQATDQGQPPVATTNGAISQVAGEGYLGGIGTTLSMPQLSLESDRQGRSRSVPMTPSSRSHLAGYRPAAAAGSSNLWSNVSPMAAAPGFACSVWPPPPLPPVNCELAARLEALEAQQISAVDAEREKRLDQLRGELQNAQASASKCKVLEVQLEQCNADWKEKFDILEARLKQSEACASRRVDEAVREADFKAKEELARLRGELQALRDDGERSQNDAQQWSQEQIDRLRREIQAARDAEQVAREEAQARDSEVNQFRIDLERQQEEVRRKAEQLRTLERRNKELIDDLDRERAGAREKSFSIEEQRRNYEADLVKIKNETEDLKLRLQQVTQQRDVLESDLQQMKKASSQREEECKRLRDGINEEKRAVRLLQHELQSRKDGNKVIAAKAQLDADLSPPLTMRTTPRQSGSVMIDVDLTEERDEPVRGNIPVARMGDMRGFNESSQQNQRFNDSSQLAQRFNESSQQTQRFNESSQLAQRFNDSGQQNQRFTESSQMIRRFSDSSQLNQRQYSKEDSYSSQLNQRPSSKEEVMETISVEWSSDA